MLVIRLLRIGKKHQPSYKIVVTDKRRPPKGGRFVDEVGSYNPITKQRILHKEKIKEWISKGAKPSDTVHNMLLQEKIIQGKKADVHKKSKKKEEKPAPEKPPQNKPEETASDQKETPDKQEKQEPAPALEKTEQAKPEVDKSS